MESYNKTNQCDLPFDKFFVNCPEVKARVLELAQVSSEAVQKIRVLDYFEKETDGGKLQQVFLIHPSHQWVRDPEVSHTRGMVFEYDGDSTVRMIAKSIPPPSKSTMEEVKSVLENEGLKPVIFPLEEGVSIRVIFSRLLHMVFVSSHRTLECRPHRWEDSTERFGEAIEKAAPGVIPQLIEDFMEGVPIQEASRTYLLTSPSVCDTNQSVAFRQIHRWLPTENDGLERDCTFSNPATETNIEALMKNYNGVIIYDQGTALCLSLLRPEYERLMELRGDSGSIMIKYSEYHGLGNVEAMNEMRRSFPKYVSRFDNYEKRSSRFIRDLEKAYRIRYVEKKFWKLPGVGHYIVKKAVDTGLSIGQILDEYSPQEYIKLLKSYFGVKTM